MSETSKRILLTGAASGLGRGLAMIFAGQGYQVVLVDVNQAQLDETAAAVAEHGAHPQTACVDVTDSAQVTRMICELGDAPIDVLINNAGLQNVSPVEEFPVEKWDLLLDVMLKGTFLMTQAVLPTMRARNYGRIVNIGSIHSLIASPFKSAYVAAKHGALGFAKAVALETAGNDITVNTICPAYIRTPLVDKQIASQAAAHGISEQEVIDKIMLAPMPKKAFITVDEIAGAVSFLISDAARNITGQTLVIDGGWTAQ